MKEEEETRKRGNLLRGSVKFRRETKAISRMMVKRNFSSPGGQSTLKKENLLEDSKSSVSKGKK